MAELINLRQARKRKARADKAAQAEQNRALFGQTKGEKAKALAEKRQGDRRIAAHKRDDPS